MVTRYDIISSKRLGNVFAKISSFFIIFWGNKMGKAQRVSDWQISSVTLRHISTLYWEIPILKNPRWRLSWRSNCIG